MGFIRPDSTTVNGGTWTASGAATAHAAINEVSASDAEFAYGADGGNNDVTFGMSNPGGSPAPAGSGTCTVRVRLAEIDTGVLAGGGANGNANPITITVADSGGQIAQTTFSPPGAWTTYATLTFDASAVTDWDTVTLQVQDTNHGGPGGNRRGGGISWAEIEFPDGSTLISPDAATHGHTAEQPSIATQNAVAPADATHGHLADQVTITDVNIAPAEAAHAHSAESPAIASNAVLTIASGTHAHVADQPAVQVPISKVFWAQIILPEEQGDIPITPADATHAHSAESPVMDASVAITPADATHGHAADQVAMTFTASLVIASATHAQAADQVTVDYKVVQRIRADGDVTPAGWSPSSGGDLFAMVDEAIPSDADYISTGTDNSVCEISLATGVDPSNDNDHVFRIRAKGDGTRDLRITLKQGVTTIAQWTEVDPPTVETTFRYDLTPVQAANITDYSALSVQLEALP